MTPTSPNALDDLRPVIDPILKLLKSRKAIVAIGTAIIDTAVLFWPAIVPQREALLAIFTGLAGVLITAMTTEDNTKTKADAQVAVAAHQASVTIAAAQVMANKLPPDASADADTQPFPPMSGSLPHR